ncbi:MAG: Gfo/Idh/MocA family oxidoreductase [Candidatus Latescibacteria bacterium]|nr:Gfo/Idh/MocA family oxidoreductase [Candidatus Latescibacterota bacterium]MBT5832594.1 Gfo/Idh/MocA family oxidoreductase [Candidatus Latescibacterota bacterium]
MKKTTAGLFGLAHPHSVAHLKTLIQSDWVEKILVFDESVDVVEQVKKTYGEKVATGYSDLDHMLSEVDVDFGIACFRNDLNADLCMRLLQTGIPVISEKPIGHTAASVEEVVKTAKEANLLLGVMYQNRYHPTTQEAKALVQSGVIGDVTACESRMVTSQVKFRNPKHWLFNNAQSGGGILSWLGCHYIDLVAYVLGEDIVQVSGTVDTLSGEDIDVEDVASLTFRFANGALGSMQAGYHLAVSGAGYMGPSYDTYMGFRGQLGRVFWEPTKAPPELHVESVANGWKTAPQRSSTYGLPQVDAYGGAHGLAFIDDFIKAIQGEGEPPTTGEDALKVARIVEAVYESSETGKRIDL